MTTFVGRVCLHITLGPSRAHAASRLVDRLVDPGWRPVNLSVFEGAPTPVAEELGAARTPSFFGKRLIVVRDCPWFSRPFASARLARAAVRAAVRAAAKVAAGGRGGDLVPKSGTR